MSKSKTFKIGEYAKGGIIKATMNEEDVTVQCIDWDTKKVLHEETTDDRHFLIMTLCDWTSSYYASEIVDWLEAQGARL